MMNLVVLPHFSIIISKEKLTNNFLLYHLDFFIKGSFIIHRDCFLYSSRLFPLSWFSPYSTPNRTGLEFGFMVYEVFNGF